MELRFQVQTKVSKPRSEVFQAVYDPQKLSGYFTTGGASGPLAEGTTVIWRFADYPADIPVMVKKMVPNERIEFEWAAGDGGDYNTKVEMVFEELSPSTTLVRIAEYGWKETPAGLKSSYENCQGWTQMACCLKAYADHGINLREGMN